MPPMGDASLPFELPSPDEVRFASGAIVKRRKRSYGKNGILLLADGRLVFVTNDAGSCWEIALSDIDRLRKPWYGMGSYLTFEVKGEYYALAFGRGGIDAATVASASSLAAQWGGTVGAGASFAGDAVVLSKLASSANLGKQWFSQLDKGSARASS
jgi:hypothetical protein